MARTPQPGAAGLANPVPDAVFSPDAVERKRSTEAVEFGPSQMVSGRIAQYSPARTKPFEEVKAQVRERVVAAKSANWPARKANRSSLPGRPHRPARSWAPPSRCRGRTPPSSRAR